MAPARTAAALAALGALAFCYAGPVGPLPNVTSTDLGFRREGSCVVGDLAYIEGDEVPGAPCERCTCGARGVQCARRTCAPRPGCKALHRPDQCCPTYQCECEQEGRVYGNGEKLVDPQDPCRVCYCQGGEVVCRRIACFVRDDCQPRLVPGRCCPEYDNCPLRGVTGASGMPTLLTTASTASSTAPTPKESAKPEITIKEITPVSEIPIITEVKIKEILPSPSIDVAEYASSKSPLIVREATSEQPARTAPPATPAPPASVFPSPPPSLVTSGVNAGKKPSNDSPPSKISLSTDGAINREIYPSVLTSLSPQRETTVTTKAPLIEEEDPTPFEHNPAFPPLPDDLSVIGNHEDEVVDQNSEIDHTLVTQEADVPASEAPTERAATSSATGSASTVNHISTVKFVNVMSTETTSGKDSPMLNLRSAIPTEILNVPSAVPEDITGELDEANQTTSAPPMALLTSSESAPSIGTTTDRQANKQELLNKFSITESLSPTIGPFETTRGTQTSQVPSEPSTSFIPKSNLATEITSQTELSSLPIETSDQNPRETADTITKDRFVPTTDSAEPHSTTTEVPTTKLARTTKLAYATTRATMTPATTTLASSTTTTTAVPSTTTKAPPATTTLSPPATTTSIASTTITSTTKTTVLETTRMPLPLETEIITVSRTIPSSTDNTENSNSFDNMETTEFVLTSFGSSESATDAVELIKISAEPKKTAAIIEPGGRKNSILTDFINLVGDVASIGDHTVPPARQATISDSEELIPVNAGYKSKNSNRNVNSITEVPLKSKNPSAGAGRPKTEIEEEADTLTDAPPPLDRAEPTTARPRIDRVGDAPTASASPTANQKDIEIITKSYVPTISRRPVKVQLPGASSPSPSPSPALAADQ